MKHSTSPRTQSVQLASSMAAYVSGSRSASAYRIVGVLCRAFEGCLHGAPDPEAGTCRTTVSNICGFMQFAHTGVTSRGFTSHPQRGANDAREKRDSKRWSEDNKGDEAGREARGWLRMPCRQDAAVSVPPASPCRLRVAGPQRRTTSRTACIPGQEGSWAR